MKTAISGTWVYATVLIFMVVLIAYVTITINYSNAYEISENIIKAIEEYEGINGKSLDRIDSLMSNMHTVKGSCSGDDAGIIDNQIYDTSKYPGPFDCCVSKNEHTINGVTKYYYSTTIFFSFSLPVLGNLYSFKIPGETMGMRYTTDTFDFK
jgi:hypothetical protein